MSNNSHKKWLSILEVTALNILQGIGPILRKVRTDRHISLEEIADATKIRTKYLQAIEDEKFDLLPGEVYAKGFINTYVRYLNIGDWPEVAEILHPVNQTPVMPSAEITPIREGRHVKAAPKRLEEKPITKKTPLIIGLSAIALVALFGIQYFYNNRLNDTEPPQKTPAPITEPENEPPIAADDQTPAEPPAEQTPENYSGLVMELEIIDVNPNNVDKCWTRVTVDGVVAFEETLAEGTKKTINGQDKITLRLGNGGIVKVTLNGKDLGLAGTGTQVITKNYTLDSLETAGSTNTPADQ